MQSLIRNPLRWCVSGTRLSWFLAAMTLMAGIPMLNAQDRPKNCVRVPAPAQFEPAPFAANLIQVDAVVRATQARQQFNVTGRGLTVAVLDTGLRTSHIDFRPNPGTPARVLAQRNFTTDNGDDQNNASDGQGHGSNVCGIVCADGGAAGHTGMAPGANIIPIKVLDNLGDGSFMAIEQGIDWVIANRTQFNISVVNMSLGSPGNIDLDDPFPTDSLRQKIQQLRTNNVAVVISAGNGYFNNGSQSGMAYPGIFPECVSVGAVYDADIGGPINYVSGAIANTTGRDRVCPFSQRRFKVPNPTTGLDTGTDIFAPGAAVISTGFQSDTAFSVPEHGTSQAAPAIAGIILLMQEYHRNLTRTSATDEGVLPSVDDLERWLRRGSVPIVDGDDEDDNVTNTNKTFRRVDAVLALSSVSAHVANELVKERVAIPQLQRVKLQKEKERADGAWKVIRPQDAVVTANPLPPNGEITVATWNLEWFFDNDKSDNTEDLPKIKSAPSAAEFDWRLNLTAAAIAQMRPTILALQEIENQKVVEALAQRIKINHGLDYSVGFVQGHDSFTEQDVAFLIQGQGQFQRGPQEPVFINSNVYNVPSKHLFLDIAWGQGAQQQKLTLVNVHLKAGADGESQRKKQSRVLRYWIKDRLAHGDNVILLGDFNAKQKFAATTTNGAIGVARGLDTLTTDDDLDDLHEFLSVPDRVSHLSGGELDRFIVSPSLRDDHGLIFQQIINRRDLSIRGLPDGSHEDYFGIPQSARDLSDHFPLIAKFKIHP